MILEKGFFSSPEEKHVCSDLDTKNIINEGKEEKRKFKAKDVN